jgi:hypothetical protein
MTIANEVLAASIHRDLMLLIKAYARMGFKEVHSGSETGFDELWRDCFQIGKSEAKQPVQRTLALVPTQTSPE